MLKSEEYCQTRCFIPSKLNTREEQNTGLAQEGSISLYDSHRPTSFPHPAFTVAMFLIWISLSLHPLPYQTFYLLALIICYLLPVILTLVYRAIFFPLLVIFLFLFFLHAEF